MSNVLEITLPDLHSAQRILHDSKTRFRVAVCGARWGKNFNAAIEQIEIGLLGKRSWHIAPDFPTSEIHWRLLKYLCGQLPGTTIREADKMIVFSQDGWVQVKSASSILRGEGLDFLTVDEAAHIPDLMTIWQEQLRARLSDRQGRALFQSTPSGLNDFHALYQLGLDAAEPEWESFQFPTSSNPHIAKSEIEAARRSLPERIFGQEYLAQFNADGGTLIRFVREVSTLSPLAVPIEGHKLCGGLDFGQSNDFTALSIYDATARQQIYCEHFRDLPWLEQRRRIAGIAKRFKLHTLLAESNSIGSVNIEALRNDGVPVQAFTTSNTSKDAIITALIVGIEKKFHGEPGGIALLNDPLQIAELQNFGAERLPSGAYRFAAKGSGHDDMVIALALSIRAGSRSHGGFGSLSMSDSRASAGLPAAPAPRVGQWFEGIFIERDGE